MGMPCTVNSILKLSPEQGYPDTLNLHVMKHAYKSGYRIIPIDVPVPLVDDQWLAHADVVIHKLTWENQRTSITFEVTRIYDLPLKLKSST